MPNSSNNNNNICNKPKNIKYNYYICYTVIGTWKIMTAMSHDSWLIQKKLLFLITKNAILINIIINTKKKMYFICEIFDFFFLIIFMLILLTFINNMYKYIDLLIRGNLKSNKLEYKKTNCVQNTK